MSEQQGTLHPTPQFARSQWLDLGGPWGFTYDDACRGIDENWQAREDVYTRTIQVPFPPEAPASGIGDPAFHPIVWYRRVFQVPDDYAGKRLLLHCGAVDYRARVWVNGQLVGMHEGGQTPFTMDITPVLRSQDEQVIVIRAEDLPGDLAQPRGKQDWQAEPHAIWYQRTTGIWQPVWLEPVSSTSITRVRWTPHVERGLLDMLISIARQDESQVARVHVCLSLRGKMLADDVYMVEGSEVQRQITFGQTNWSGNKELLWSPAHPNLIDVTITLLIGEQVVDEVQSYIGLRSIAVERGRFLLNSSPYYLRLVLEQGYWPQSHLAAPNVEAMRREVELAKELGFNGIRIHQKVEDPRFLYWCDRLGLLVWGEMANAYIFSPTAVERLTREWLEVIERDYNHPCIVVWVPLNESWGIPNVARDPQQRHYMQALYHLTKALDPTRPVIANDGWEQLSSDIYGVHDYAFNGDTLRARYGTAEALAHTLQQEQPGSHALLLPGNQYTDEPVMLSECGGISETPKPGESWYGYGTVKDREAYLAKYRDVIDAILACSPLAGFCYTQLTDTLQEKNGLLTEQREPKLDPASVYAITRRDPRGRHNM